MGIAPLPGSREAGLQLRAQDGAQHAATVGRSGSRGRRHRHRRSLGLQRGMGDGYMSAPGRPNHNMKVDTKPAQETMAERAHVAQRPGRGPTYLSEFAMARSATTPRSSTRRSSGAAALHAAEPGRRGRLSHGAQHRPAIRICPSRRGHVP